MCCHGDWEPCTDRLAMQAALTHAMPSSVGLQPVADCSWSGIWQQQQQFACRLEGTHLAASLSKRQQFVRCRHCTGKGLFCGSSLRHRPFAQVNSVCSGVCSRHKPVLFGMRLNTSLLSLCVRWHVAVTACQALAVCLCSADDFRLN